MEPEHIRVVVPLPKNLEEIRRTIREEIEYKGFRSSSRAASASRPPKRHDVKKTEHATMKQDIILSGVGGQGILSIATVIGAAALEEGLHIKQAEVHGMSQRGGDVQSNLRISSVEILPT